MIDDMLLGIAKFQMKDIGIMTLYGAQAEAYADALQVLDTRYPGSSSADIKVETVEWWVNRPAEIIIFEMVRTWVGCAGKESHLSHTTRLQVALTAHS